MENETENEVIDFEMENNDVVDITQMFKLCDRVKNQVAILELALEQLYADPVIAKKHAKQLGLAYEKIEWVILEMKRQAILSMTQELYGKRK